MGMRGRLSQPAPNPKAMHVFISSTAQAAVKQAGGMASRQRSSPACARGVRVCVVGEGGGRIGGQPWRADLLGNLHVLTGHELRSNRQAFVLSLHRLANCVRAARLCGAAPGLSPPPPRAPPASRPPPLPPAPRQPALHTHRPPPLLHAHHAPRATHAPCRPPPPRRALHAWYALHAHTVLSECSIFRDIRKGKDIIIKRYSEEEYTLVSTHVMRCDQLGGV